ncbi:heme oxygenase [Paenibacillus gorillae]|uniref:heme oxygenase n=1 Tax=Paenibacillus gorillae TaxID=1243662 RepID=UPI0004AD28DB|nr:heme oxygenase [Paenibacillus gorillae]
MSAIEMKELDLERGMFRLHDVTASIPKGQMTAIIGPNGSGKSTLLKLVAQLLEADSGAVLIDGKEGKTFKRAELARTISMLPQAKDTAPYMTVRELVAYGRSPHQGLLRQRLTEEDTSIIQWALKQTGILRHEDRMFHTLSGGEQQKARIAMALAQKTGIVLLDEPTTYLDISHQLDVMEMLRKLNKQLNLTIVMVLHDLQQAAAFCDYLIAMDGGQIADAGHPKSIINSRLLRDVFELEAKVSYEEDYPIIIPKLKKLEEDKTMVIVTNVSKITKGNGEKLIERFNKVGKVEGMEGFLGLEVMLTENTKEYDEVSVVTRWESKENFQAWTRSEAFRESHQHRKTPDYIIDNKIQFYEVKIVRNPLPLEA